MWRAFHHPNHVHKADHFYNFCVTSNAMKDHFFEWKGIIGPTKNEEAQRKRHHDSWKAMPELQAASEIGNSMKHFVLRDKRTGNPISPRTQLVRKTRTSVAHVFVNAKGEGKVIRDSYFPSITIEFEHGQKFKLYEFMNAIVCYWRDFLLAEGVQVKKQRASHLYGTTARRKREPSA